MHVSGVSSTRTEFNWSSPGESGPFNQCIEYTVFSFEKKLHYLLWLCVGHPQLQACRAVLYCILYG